MSHTRPGRQKEIKGDIGYCNLSSCKTPKEEVEICPDGVCRNCHVSVGWDNCVTGTFNAKQLLKTGRTKDQILELYPEAQL